MKYEITRQDLIDRGLTCGLKNFDRMHPTGEVHFEGNENEVAAFIIRRAEAWPAGVATAQRLGMVPTVGCDLTKTELKGEAKRVVEEYEERKNRKA